MQIINRLIVQSVKLMPEWALFIFAKKYIAGKSLDDAIRVVRELNSKGILATMDVLGESVTNKSGAEAAKYHCLETLDAIEKENLNSNISIKPTQLGLAIDKEFCYDQISEILDRAKSYNNFVRIDMEDSNFTSDTIDVFLRLKNNYDNVGLVVQAYLRRTIDDVERLNSAGTNYRLCKGIYIEPEKIAYKGKKEIRDNYLRILENILGNESYVGIATHDDYLINNAYRLLKDRRIQKGKYEFQMLYGVTEPLRNKINSDGHKIRIYVPYGEHWRAYSIRRLQENPQLAWYIFKSLFSFK